MVSGLCSALDDCNCFASVNCGFGKNLEEESFAHVVRARASDQISARLQNLHGPEIDLFVPALGRRQAIAVLSEGRRIENNHVETSVDLVIFFQQVECVCYAKGGVGNGIQLLIAARGVHCRPGHIDALHMVTMACNRKGESSLVGKTVQHLVGCILPRGPMVLALVEEGTGFLLAAEIVGEGDTVFFCRNFVRDFAVENADLLVESLEQTYLGVVSLKNALGRKKLDENFANEALDSLGGLAESLDDKIIAVTVHDE